MNEEKREILEAFNKHFCECVNDVHRVFPNDNTIGIMSKSLNMLLMVTKTQVIQVFKNNVLENYSKQIKEGDLSFFINKNYNDDLNNNGYNTDIITKHIDYIKDLVKQMTNEEQKSIIKYFQNLMTLCNLYYEL